MKDYMLIANKLHLNLVDDFSLVYDNGEYKLNDMFKPFCHYLELCLITDDNKNLTGNKINDICLKMGVSKKWVVGFYHGHKNVSKRFNFEDYTHGYIEGQKLKEKNVPMQNLS